VPESDDPGEGPESAMSLRQLRSRARLADVARLAGVGIATVDRVLNERGNVSPATARKVIEAARQLALPRTLPMPYRRGLRVEVMMVRRETPFSERLSAAFQRVASTLDRSVIVQRNFVDETKPREVAERMLATNADALILFGQEDVAIVDAVTRLTSNGVPVVTMVSDLPTSPRLAYVGIDHYGAGRSAAFFMAHMVHRAGPVVVLTHSFAYRAHAERVSGFRDGLADYNPAIPIAGIIEGRDQQMQSEQMVLELLRQHGGAVAGIYNTGGANRAIERAVAAVGLVNKVVFIGHELTVHTARMLSAGVMTLAIDQNPEQQARKAIDVLLRRFGYTSSPAESGDVPYTIFSPENVPAELAGGP
jgi:LacI family transcriptional regulator